MLTRARAKHRVFFFPLMLLYEGNTINNGEKGDPRGQNAGIDPDARIMDLRTRSILEDAYTELQKANIGTLIGVLLLNPRTKSLDVSIEPAEGENGQSLLKRIGAPNTERMIRVRYLDEPPASVLRHA